MRERQAVGYLLGVLSIRGILLLGGLFWGSPIFGPSPELCQDFDTLEGDGQEGRLARKATRGPPSEGLRVTPLEGSSRKYLSKALEVTLRLFGFNILQRVCCYLFLLPLGLAMFGKGNDW